jgi:DUF4097 and DUF4098 domain-containing protein YvlB
MLQHFPFRSGILIFSGLFILLLTTPVLAATDYYHTEKAFPIEMDGVVVVETNFYDVEVATYSGSLVEVRVKMEATASTKKQTQKLITNHQPIFKEENGNLRISSIPETRSSFVKNHQISGTVTIKIPANINLNVNTTSGTCLFQGDYGKAHITSSTSSGNISFQGKIWGLNVQSLSGNVKADFTHPVEYIDCETLSGGIRINGPVNYARLKSTSGNVNLNEAVGKVLIETTSGNINAGWNSVSPYIQVEASSVSGDLWFRFPQEAELAGRINTRFGHIRSDFPVVISNHNTHTLEGGSEAIRINLETVSGSIKLVAWSHPYFAPFEPESASSSNSSNSNPSVEVYKPDPTPLGFLNLYKFNDVFAPGLKYQIKNHFYITSNLEYSSLERDLHLQIGSIYLIPHKVLFFRFYGGGGVEFSNRDGYLYPYLLMGTDFLFFFSEVLYPWETETVPSFRNGFSIKF